MSSFTKTFNRATSRFIRHLKDDLPGPIIPPRQAFPIDYIARMYSVLFGYSSENKTAEEKLATIWRQKPTDAEIKYLDMMRYDRSNIPAALREEVKKNELKAPDDNLDGHFASALRNVRTADGNRFMDGYGNFTFKYRPEGYSRDNLRLVLGK